MKVFLSYAKEDSEIAKRLYGDLKQAGFEPWDEDDIDVGQHVSLFNREIKDSSIILLLFSTYSVSKRGEFVKQQKLVLKLLDTIPDSETFIIPVRLDDCELLDERLQTLKPADLFPSYENGVKKILNALHRKKADMTESSLVRQSEFYYEDRFLDAAMPEKVTKNEETELLIMIRLPDSEGLRGILGSDSQYEAQAKDVKSSESFPVEYPIDERGNVLGIDLVIEIETNDFCFSNNETQKKIRVLPSTDSPTRTFFLTPIKTGELRVLIQLYYSESIIASGVLKVNGRSFLDKNLIVIKKIITLSLGVFGVSNQYKFPKTISDNNTVNIGKDAEGSIIVSGDGNTINILSPDQQKSEPQNRPLMAYIVISLIVIAMGIAYWWSITRLEIELIRVPGGEYMMGCITGDTECEDNEKPPHKVSVKSFMLGKYEVTQGQWKNIMRNNPSSVKRGYNYPVENVSWDDIQEFIRKLNEKTGKKYRLPTEAEWEFACRSGGKNDRYSGGDASNSQDSIHPVGKKKPNDLGIYDMSGNVWEWCEDVYCPDAYENRNCQQQAAEPERVIRGGSWQYSAANSRCTSRRGQAPVQTSDDIGFRLVME